MEKPSLDTAKAGAMRFNTDSSQMEIYDGNQWTGILATSPEQQTGGTRGLFVGGRNPSNSDTIDFVNIDTTGNATDFGNRLEAGRQDKVVQLGQELGESYVEDLFHFIVI